jgi:hypothetical protein
MSYVRGSRATSYEYIAINPIQVRNTSILNDETKPTDYVMEGM